jgi:hypothetical protein
MMKLLIVTIKAYYVTLNERHFGYAGDGIFYLFILPITCFEVAVYVGSIMGCPKYLQFDLCRQYFDQIA